MDKKNSCVQVYENTEADVGCTKFSHITIFKNFTATREPCLDTLAGLITGRKKQ